MKTLRSFWHWHRHEKPSSERAGELLPKNLSPLAAEALTLAMRLIAARALPSKDDWPALMAPLERLSLALCTELGAMHEAVPCDAPGTYVPLVCHACGRLSATEHEHLSHPCV